MKTGTMHGRCLNIRSRIRLQFWDRFNYTKTKETHGDPKLLLDNQANISVPAPCTHREIVETIARQSQKVIAIESLAPVLSRTKFVFARNRREERSELRRHGAIGGEAQIPTVVIRNPQKVYVAASPDELLQATESRCRPCQIQTASGEVR